MSVLRGMIKKVFGEAPRVPSNLVDLALLLPRLFVLRPNSGDGLDFLRKLEEFEEEHQDSRLGDGPRFREALLVEAEKFAEIQRAEIDDTLEQFSASTAEFLDRMAYLVEVQNSRLTEIESIRENLEKAQSAETIEETRRKLKLSMVGLQQMVETELLRHTELCQNREIYTARLEDRLKVVEKESKTDVLTSIANRAGCMKKLEGVLDYLRTNRSEFCLALLDLNGFKSINDTLGHAAGDTALVAFSQRLVSAVGKNNFVGRLAGDEFIVISNSSSTTLASMLHRLSDQLAAYPPTHKGLVLGVSFCFGICTVEKGATSSSVLEEADRMLYRNKNVYYDSLAA
jgi:diguanylate cyclase (GGDEF)-like protein